MELTPICAGNVIGLDVHLKQVTACAIVVGPAGLSSTITREFSTVGDGLQELASWCQSLNPEIVAMESTGVYWVSVYRAIHSRDVQPMVVNAQHVKKVPGRKTDASDSHWLATLARAGLLKPSFVTTPEFMDIRSHARARQKLASDLTKAKNRLDKTLVEAGIRLGAVVSDIHGLSARRMIECLIEGGTPEEALSLAGTRLKASPEELLMALKGDLSSLRRATLLCCLNHIKHLEAEIANMDFILLQALRPYQESLDLLQTIPGLGEIGAALLLAEIGPDITAFGGPDVIASWAGLCPGNNESAGKKKSGRTRKGNRWIRRVLCEAAHAAVRTECALKAKFNDLIRRRGYKRSIVAIAHKILRIVFAILKKKEPYKDATVNYEELMVKKNASRWINALRKYHRLGVEGKTLEATSQSDAKPSKPRKKAPQKEMPKPEVGQPENGPVKRKRGRPKKVVATTEVKAA
jgi:transposase